MNGRSVLLAALFALVAAAAFAQDFRKVAWGMSMDEVIAAENGLQFSRLSGSSGSMLSASVDVMSHAGVLAYIFDSGRLVMAQYKLDDDDSLSTFEEIMGILTDKYGQPADSGISSTRWSLERTLIRLSSRDSLCQVDYADQAWLDRMKEKRSAQYDSLF